MKGGSHGKLLVTVGVLGGDRSGEIQDAVCVAAVAVIAGVVTPCMITVRVKNLLDSESDP